MSEEQIIQPTEIPIVPSVAPKKSNLPLIFSGVLFLLFVVAGSVFAGMKIQEKKSLGGLTSGSIINSLPTLIPVTCGPCPQFSPPHPDFCKDGTIIPGEKNECGCQMPPTCDRTTSNWKTYTNTKFGISLKYPSEILVCEFNYVILFIHNLPEYSCSDVKRDSPVFLETNPETIIKEYKQITRGAYKTKEQVIDGKTISVLTEGSESGTSFTTGLAQFKCNPGTCFLEVEGADDSAFVIFDQILSTFKFLE